jgi:phospholipid/cholesterol/gamma-HCH transport system permease protein
MLLLAGIGRTVLSAVGHLVGAGTLLVRTVASVTRLRPRSLRVVSRVTARQLLFTGVQAVLPLTVAAIAVGTLVLYEAVLYLPAEYIETASVAILVREVIPLLTAFLLIGRSGTAITIEVGTMKLNDELAALTVMGIPFEHFVMLPRLIGMVLSFALLQVYADVAALAGGYLVSELIQGHPLSFPLGNLLRAVDPSDLTLSLLKVSLFGVVVAVVAAEHGLAVGASRRDVPIATTAALVHSLLLCFLINTAVSLTL